LPLSTFSLQILHWLAAYGRRGFEPIWDDDKLMTAVPAIWEPKNLFDFKGHSPLHLAAVTGNASAISHLSKRLEQAQTLTDTRERTPLHLASREGNHEVVKALLEAGWAVDGRDIRQRTPLMYAAEAGDGRSLNELLRSGADADARDKNDSSALDLAAQQGHAPVIAVMVAAKKVFLNDVQAALKKNIETGESTLGIVRKLIAKNASVEDILNPDESDSESSYDPSDSDDNDGPRTKHSGRSGGMQRRSSTSSSNKSSSAEEDDDDEDYDNEEPRSPREASEKQKSDSDSDGEEFSYANFVVSDGPKPPPKQAKPAAKKNPYHSDSDSDSDNKFSDEEDSDNEKENVKSSNSSFENDDDELAAVLVKNGGEKGAMDLSAGTIFESKRPKASKQDTNDEIDPDEWDDIEDIDEKVSAAAAPFAVKRAGSANRIGGKGRKVPSDSVSDVSESYDDFDDAEMEISEAGLRFAVKKTASASQLAKPAPTKHADEAGEESWDDDFADAGDVRAESTAPVASANPQPSMADVKQFMAPAGGAPKKGTITPEMFQKMTGQSIPRQGTPPVPRKASDPALVPSPKPATITITDDDDDDWASGGDDDEEEMRRKLAAERGRRLEEPPKPQAILPKRAPPAAPSREMSSTPPVGSLLVPRHLSEDEAIEQALSAPASNGLFASPVEPLSEEKIIEMARKRESLIPQDRQLEMLAQQMERKIDMVKSAQQMTKDLERTVLPLLPNAATLEERKAKYADMVRGHVHVSQLSLAVDQLQQQVAKSQRDLIEASEQRRRSRLQLAASWSEFFRLQERSSERLARSVTQRNGTSSGAWTQRDFFMLFLYLGNGLAVFVLGFIAAVTMVGPSY
jgi:hypothetical protein